MNAASCLLAVMASPSVLLAQQFVQLPDNHFLGESPTQSHASGSANFWGGASSTGRRFQVLYDGSHFTNVQGVTGPLVLRRVLFRGEDTEHNAGGQTFTNVTASLYRTSRSAAVAMSPTFAQNLAPPAPFTATLLGTIVVPALTVGASLGRAPNNDLLALDFSAVALAPFDPTGASGPETHLLLDVQYTTASAAADPQGTTMVPIQDSSGPLASVRGRAVHAASALAASGTATNSPPTLRIEFVGSGGVPAPGAAAARNERFGAACGGSAASFYQLFAHDEFFDLGEPGQADGLRGLRLVPDQYPAPTHYRVEGGAAPVDLVHGLAGSPLLQAEDATLPFALPAGVTFEYPGGPVGGTPVVRPSSNGYVIVDPASAETAADYSPTVGEFLGSTVASPARFAPFWHDFSPQRNSLPPFGQPLAGVHAANHLAGHEVLITWYQVGRFNAVAEVFQESHTLQLSLDWQTGVVEFRYGPMDEIWGDTFNGQTSGLVGFSLGRLASGPSADPMSRDLSIERGPLAPFATSAEGASHLGLTAVASPAAGGLVHMGRAFAGQTLHWNVDHVPPGAIVGLQLIDTAATRPGLQLPGLVAPGCRFSLSAAATVHEVHVLPGSTVTGALPLHVPSGYQPGLLGFDLFAQYVVLDGLFGGPDLITAASHAVRHRVGYD